MEQQELELLLNEHHTITRAAAAAGISYDSIRYWMKVWGLESRRHKACDRKTTPKTKLFCQNCGKDVGYRPRPNVFCSLRCQQQYRRRVNVENGVACSRSVKSYLIECRGYRCELCGYAEWMGKPVTLELDHKDGDHENNSLDNLRLICPNCHAQTETYKNRNKGRGRHSRRAGQERLVS